MGQYVHHQGSLSVLRSWLLNGTINDLVRNAGLVARFAQRLERDVDPGAG